MKNHVQIIQREAGLFFQFSGKGTLPCSRAANHNHAFHKSLPFPSRQVTNKWPKVRTVWAGKSQSMGYTDRTGFIQPHILQRPKQSLLAQSFLLLQEYSLCCRLTARRCRFYALRGCRTVLTEYRSMKSRELPERGSIAIRHHARACFFAQ